MKTEIKTRWLEALRSGDYSQAKGFLVKLADDGTASHCCLGVLCEIAAAEGVVTREEVECGCHEGDECSLHNLGFTGEAEDPHGKYKSWSYSVLPYPVMEWAGIDENDPSIPDADVPLAKRHLSGLNDDGADFDEIANLIEEHL